MLGYNHFKNLTSERKMFYIFLAIHFIVWTCVGLIRTVMPTDTLEGIYWGSLHDFGTPKHPPLAGWLTYLAYIPFKLDICTYLLSQLFILGGFIFTYKLARKFLDESKSMLSVIILEGCWVYSYITGYYGFNPDVILLFILPLISYIFYFCMKDNKPINWVMLGLVVGIAFLNKYQTGFIIFAMAIYALMFKREIFKNIWFYVSTILAFVIFLPHLLWLIKYDFFPLLYFEGEMTADSWLNHLTAPLMFLLMQLAAIGGALLIYLILRLKFKAPFRFIQDYNKKEFWFIVILGLGPILMHLVMGFFAGGNMRARWGYEFWYMLGIMLFYFFPFEINKEEFKFATKSAYVVMLIIFLALGGLLSIEMNYRSRYPVATVYGDLQKAWAEKYDTPVKYLGGYIEWTLPITIYGENHPMTIQDTHGYPDPWITEDERKASGILVIDRYPILVEARARDAAPYLDKDYKIEPIEYKFMVKNAFGMEREYTIYYAIIPPMK